MKANSSELNARPTAAFVNKGPNLLRNWETGRCLDSNANGAVYTNPCRQDNAFQNWVVVYDSHGTYDQVNLMNAATGKYLRWSTTKPWAAAYADSGTAAYIEQVWQAVGPDWDKIQLMDPDSAGAGHLCLGDYSAEGVHFSTCDTSNGIQQWKLGY